ncbi:aldo/keto reductase, partial [Sulfolobus sp. B5]
IGRKEIKDEYRWYVLAREAYVKSIEPLVEEINSIAKQLNKSPAQVVLNWLIMKDNVFAIFNSTKQEHIKDNLGSIGWKLGEEALRKLDEAVKKVTIDYFIK